MRNLILYRKIFVLTLATVLLVFGIQDISFGQLPVSPDRIQDDSTRYVVWIVTDEGSSGSGVLIHKAQRLVVTNAHVVRDNKEVQVFFAVRDSSGKILRARPFYTSVEHRSTLKRLGYVTRGRVIAKNPEMAPDLALVELDGFPETARELYPSTDIDYSKMKSKPIHILGHPSERPLWQWDRGDFEGDYGKDLHLSANAYYGNSGGPVLNEYGKLIGITRAINEKTRTYAVPTRSIIDLYKTLEPVKIFSIYNNTGFPMSYEVQWKKDGEWKKEVLEPQKEMPHVGKFSREYPKIRFGDIQDGKASAESVRELETKIRYFGKGITSVRDHIETDDALRYQFEFNPEAKKVSLVKLKLVKAFWIYNAAEFPIVFEYKWHEDNEWKKEYIKSGGFWRYGRESEKVSIGYPKIRFDEITDNSKNSEKNWDLEVQTGYFGKDTEINKGLDQLPNVYRVYHFKSDLETKKIFLEKLELTQAFLIQNATESPIFFQYRWNEDNKWEPGYIYSNGRETYQQPSEKVSIGYPKIRFDEIIEDSEYSEKNWRLETQTEYVNRNTQINEVLNHLNPRRYHFKYDSETKKISLYQGLLAKSEKSTDRSFPFFLIALIVVLIIEVIVIVGFVVFPKRHIFSLQNNTETIVDYQTKWTKKGNWKLNSLEPGKSRNHWRTGSLKKVPQDYPKARFETTVDDKKETKEYTLETYSWRLGSRGVKKISREKHAREYHFEIDTETKVLNLVDSEEDDQ